MITITVETDEEQADVMAMHEDGTLMREYGDFSYAIRRGRTMIAGGGRAENVVFPRAGRGFLRHPGPSGRSARRPSRITP